MTTHNFSYASELGWANGEGPSKYAGSVASFDPDSAGIDIFRSPGELRTGFSSSEIGGATVDGTILMMIPTAYGTGATVTRQVYAYADNGDLYHVTDAATPVVTLDRAVTSYRDFICLHKDYIYYDRSTNIGRWGPINAGSPAADDTYITSVGANHKGINISHPMHSWNGSMYYGDAEELKSVLGSEGTGTSGTVEITLDSDHTITYIWDNGDLLLFGAGMEPSASSASTNIGCWLYTWNGTDTSFTDRFAFPEPYIHNIKVLDNEIVVFGTKNVYRLDGSSFKILSSLAAYVGPGGVWEYNNQLFWKENGYIKAIGSPDPQLPTARYRPFNGTGTSKGAICWVAQDKLWVGDNNNLNEYKTGSSTSNTWKSRFISFGEQRFISEVRVYLSTPLVSGDDLSINIINAAGTSTEVAELKFSSDGAIDQKVLHANGFANAVDQLSGFQLGVGFDAGAVRVRDIVIISKPIAQR